MTLINSGVSAISGKFLITVTTTTKLTSRGESSVFYREWVYKGLQRVACVVSAPPCPLNTDPCAPLKVWPSFCDGHGGKYPLRKFMVSVLRAPGAPKRFVSIFSSIKHNHSAKNTPSTLDLRFMFKMRKSVLTGPLSETMNVNRQFTGQAIIRGNIHVTQPALPWYCWCYKFNQDFWLGLWLSRGPAGPLVELGGVNVCLNAIGDSW